MYAITHKGKAIGPDGLITDVNGTPLEAQHADDYNAQLAAQELEHIKSGPDKLTLYIGKKPMTGDPATTFNVGKLFYAVTNWPGTWLGWAYVGPRAHTGFGYNSYRRPVTVRLFGTLYNGWWMESSGDYVRLRKAKKQDVKYGATLAEAIA